MSSKRVISRLVSSSNSGFFVNLRRKKSDKRKLEIKKFDPVVNKRVIFIEKKRF